MEASYLMLISAGIWSLFLLLFLVLLRFCRRLLKMGLSWLLGASLGGAKEFSSDSLSLSELPELSSLSIVSSSVVLSFGCNSGGNKSENLIRKQILKNYGHFDEFFHFQTIRQL